MNHKKDFTAYLQVLILFLALLAYKILLIMDNFVVYFTADFSMNSDVPFLNLIYVGDGYNFNG